MQAHVIPESIASRQGSQSSKLQLNGSLNLLIPISVAVSSTCDEAKFRDLNQLGQQHTAWKC